MARRPNNGRRNSEKNRGRSGNRTGGARTAPTKIERAEQNRDRGRTRRAEENNRRERREQTRGGRPQTTAPNETRRTASPNIREVRGPARPTPRTPSTAPTQSPGRGATVGRTTIDAKPKAHLIPRAAGTGAVRGALRAAGPIGAAAGLLWPDPAGGPDAEAPRSYGPSTRGGTRRTRQEAAPAATPAPRKSGSPRQERLSDDDVLNKLSARGVNSRTINQKTMAELRALERSTRNMKKGQKLD